VLAALLSVSFGAAFPTVEIETYKLKCDSNAVIQLAPTVFRPVSNELCSTVTVCDGTNRVPIARRNILGNLDDFVSAIGPRIPLDDATVEAALLGCKASCKCVPN
jgi:hypothetical protein